MRLRTYTHALIPLSLAPPRAKKPKKPPRFACGVPQPLCTHSLCSDPKPLLFVPKLMAQGCHLLRQSSSLISCHLSF
eukprot:jgi/Botrbrau1/4850/Bobra.0032s0011.1